MTLRIARADDEADDAPVICDQRNAAAAAEKRAMVSTKVRAPQADEEATREPGPVQLHNAPEIGS